MKKLLHVGCGRLDKRSLTPGFRTDEWDEVRLDIDPAVEPDIIGTMTDMGNVGSASVDAIYSSHNLEHVFPHEVQIVLAEFLRVLKPGGFVVLTCPDLQSVCEAVVNDRLNDVLYVSSAGPITPQDVLYGHIAAIAEGRHYMAHKCGFTYKTLCEAFGEAGFANYVGGRRPEVYDLWLMAYKTDTDVPEAERLEQARLYLP